jgi:hypothetical protein
VLDAPATRYLKGFEELTYAAGGARPSDHCSVVALIK